MVLAPTGTTEADLKHLWPVGVEAANGRPLLMLLPESLLDGMRLQVIAIPVAWLEVAERVACKCRRRSNESSNAQPAVKG